MGKSNDNKKQLDQLKNDPQIKKVLDRTSSSKLKGGWRTTTPTCNGVVPQ